MESLKQGGSLIAVPVKNFLEPDRNEPYPALPGYNETHWVNLDGTLTTKPTKIAKVSGA